MRDAETGKRWKHVLGTADDMLEANGRDVLSYSQALDRARSWFAQPRANSLDTPPLKTVRDVVQQYLAWLDDNRKMSTACDARYKANARILPTLGDIPIEKLKSSTIRRWHEDLAKAPVRRRTRAGKPQNFAPIPGSNDEDWRRRRRASANRALTILKAALNQAHEAEQIATDDAWRRLKLFKNTDAARVRYLNRDECQRLLNACPPDFRQIVRGAILTGCRYGELRRLRVRDFDSESATLHIVFAKGGARAIPLDWEAAAFLVQQTVGRPHDDFIFPRGDGKPWQHSQQQRRIEEASAAANLLPAVNFHALRHTWASHRVMAGVPLMVVAELLGHADTRMVQKHYGHLAPGFVRDVINATSLNLSAEPSNVTEFRPNAAK